MTFNRAKGKIKIGRVRGVPCVLNSQTNTQSKTNGDRKEGGKGAAEVRGGRAGEREVYWGSSDPCLTNLCLSVSAPWTKVNGPHPHLASPPAFSFTHKSLPPTHTDRQRKHKTTKITLDVLYRSIYASENEHGTPDGTLPKLDGFILCIHLGMSPGSFRKIIWEVIG